MSRIAWRHLREHFSGANYWYACGKNHITALFSGSFALLCFFGLKRSDSQNASRCPNKTVNQYETEARSYAPHFCCRTRRTYEAVFVKERVVLSVNKLTVIFIG